MDDPIPFWYDAFFFGSLISTIIAYPIVALLVTRPIQRNLQQKNQDHISDWVVWPFKSGWYAMAIVVPFERINRGRNPEFMNTVQPIRQAANRLQWWLSLWLEVSMFSMVLIGFAGMLFQSYIV